LDDILVTIEHGLPPIGDIGSSNLFPPPPPSNPSARS
jgi:hypothetical protein